jgi:hypothetical protein
MGGPWREWTSGTAVLQVWRDLWHRRPSPGPGEERRRHWLMSRPAPWTSWNFAILPRTPAPRRPGILSHRTSHRFAGWLSDDGHACPLHHLRRSDLSRLRVFRERRRMGRAEAQREPDRHRRRLASRLTISASLDHRRRFDGVELGYPIQEQTIATTVAAIVTAATPARPASLHARLALSVPWEDGPWRSKRSSAD